MHAAWIEHGPDVIRRVIQDEPATFLKCAVALMPKDIAIQHTHTVDPIEFGSRFKQAMQLLGNDAIDITPRNGKKMLLNGRHTESD